MRGIWMWPTNVRLYGAQRVVQWCQKAGVTDIFFLSKGLGGVAAWRSAVAPCEEEDLLRSLLDAAHAQGLRVHAWFTSASDERYKARHPESGRWHYIKGADQGLIALDDAGYLDYMTQAVEELVRGWEIDGLHLDYIRYNHLIYGWSESDMARYAAAGADPVYLKAMMDRMYRAEHKEGELLFDAWRAGNESARAVSAVRRADVVRFAARLTGAARAIRPELTLSAALMPEGAYEDIAFSDLHYGQNYEDAAKLYDLALPMAYSKAYEKDASWVRMVAEGTMKRGLKTLVGLHAYEGGTGASLRADIEALEGCGAEGFCLFREGATALAYQDGKDVCLINPTGETITRVIATDGERSQTVIEPFPAGGEKCLRLSFAPTGLRVFHGEKEGCVFLAE